MAVLLVDCQTTAGSPQKGHLLEIGWMVIQAEDRTPAGALALETHLVALPEGERLPAPVRRLTGIDDAMLAEAVPPEAAWQMLSKAAASVARATGTTHCPTVIHYARFERSFLNALHKTADADRSFPFDIVCTHEIARRLYPALPRKGLRALAGYLGHSVPMAKRCSDHLRATAAIWRQVVPRLKDDFGIETFVDLKHWLAGTPVPRAIPRSYPMDKARRQELPDRPGVYRFLRANGDLLYIGKARSLKVRLNSYFQPGRRHSERTLEMLSQAMQLAVTTTGTALEAALMESEAIKRFDPPYNVALTKGTRTLQFVSRDFAAQAEQPDDLCRIGPLMNRTLGPAVHALGRALADETSPDSLNQLLSALFTSIEQPEEALACLQDGVALFKETHADLLSGQRPWRSLMAIGRRQWLERQAAEDGDTEESSEDSAEADDQQSETTEKITPEAVCRRMASLLRHCHQQLRRARWLVLLSESVVAWQVPNGRNLRVLVIEKGKVSDHHQVESFADMPRPPGAGRTWRERQNLMDLQSYDRLRVLTTEVRRLLTEGRLVYIAVGQKTVLEPEKLRQLLQWV